ncbi:cytochrome c oxidase subunit 4 [Amnibacterium flavum]|uniref:Cytochrome c oxidase polypeptide 4 n=1 Tax=Amnibacterium flavum TaxID=2173173 RepID=A0A2V1HQN9_9MICO|nr:cytochrome c oxidase subunit 4 [Amnibacterium flavum]PVZ94661.1 cytochrome c oxidase subunit IV [Amnibacterium flavum]
MKVNTVLFWLLSLFFGILAVVYAWWTLADDNWTKPEWVGTVGLTLASIFAAFLAFYIQRSWKSQGGELPEDRSDASIDDGDPELGFFSPWSWWPIILAASATLGFLGLAVGVWITFIGFGLFLVAITGWVYEYYRGYFAR